MTTHDWETEDGTGTAIVGEIEQRRREATGKIGEAMLADPHGVLSVTVDDALLTLAQKVYDYEQRVAELEAQVTCQNVLNDEFDFRLDKLQDANLAPMLESSAVIVELRRIADAQERQASALEWIANGFGSNGETGWLRTANDGRTDRDLSS